MSLAVEFGSDRANMTAIVTLVKLAFKPAEVKIQKNGTGYQAQVGGKPLLNLNNLGQKWRIAWAGLGVIPVRIRELFTALAFNYAGVVS